MAAKRFAGDGHFGDQAIRTTTAYDRQPMTSYSLSVYSTTAALFRFVFETISTFIYLA